MSRIINLFRKSINPPYRPADLITLFLTLFIFITIPLVVIAATNEQSLKSNAQSLREASCLLPRGSEDTTEPSVYFENPIEGEKLAGQASLIKIVAKDNVCVEKVSLLIDGVLVKTFTYGPYEYLWDLHRIEPGNHAISAQVVDYSGNFSMASVSVFRGVKGISLP